MFVSLRPLTVSGPNTLFAFVLSMTMPYLPPAIALLILVAIHIAPLLPTPVITFA
ncbi:hypothetical protein BDV93DRAFT_119871 [Ceratobasidium sp. AG-I]|nr:hypothetical protein BDV93DRAFT_119871 [Ceratobasidium sp. AG-I]